MKKKVKKVKATKKAVKRNPNDATFRNINALKRRVEKLERQFSTVLAVVLSSK